MLNLALEAVLVQEIQRDLQLPLLEILHFNGFLRFILGGGRVIERNRGMLLHLRAIAGVLFDDRVGRLGFILPAFGDKLEMLGIGGVVDNIGVGAAQEAGHGNLFSRVQEPR